MRNMGSKGDMNLGSMFFPFSIAKSWLQMRQG